MIHKVVLYFGQPMGVACDARCDKAWGINNRPRVRFGDEDDYAFLADDELGTAPTDPGTYEGGVGKPQGPEYRLNKWCVRECERSSNTPPQLNVLCELPDFSHRHYNQPWKHEESERE